ncbi:hypothetical protein BASA82_000533 [Batrachochytrium salamandrivorans]|nr:hypothetical protein BASA82_000533 [Batrachochytrium salamandrivorans]
MVFGVRLASCWIACRGKCVLPGRKRVLAKRKSKRFQRSRITKKFRPPKRRARSMRRVFAVSASLRLRENAFRSTCGGRCWTPGDGRRVAEVVRAFLFPTLNHACGPRPVSAAGQTAGQVTVSKSTATCLVMWRDLVLCGTAEGSLILHSSSQPQQQPQVMVLKPKRPVLKLVKAFANTCVLALCGGEVFCFELVNGLLTRRVVGELHAFAMPVVDICVNQRDRQTGVLRDHERL